MADDRSQFLDLFLGGQKSGKSYFANERLNDYYKSTGKHVLIVDPDGREKIWWKYQQITLTQVRNFSGIKRIVFDPEDPDFILKIKTDFINGLLVYDDPGSYNIYNPSKIFEAQIIRRRGCNIDIFFLYHGFSKVHEKIWPYITHVILFRVDENAYAGSDLLKKETQKWQDRILSVRKMVSTKNPWPKKIYQLIKHIS